MPNILKSALIQLELMSIKSDCHRGSTELMICSETALEQDQKLLKILDLDGLPKSNYF